jgi:ElaB/YqjD/DUF883 family membrane-anchored ribosome-binding protein
MNNNLVMNERGQSGVTREQVLSDLETLTHDAEELLKATASDMSDKAMEARNRVSAALERAKNACAQLQQQTISAAKAATKKADTLIRDHPYESIGLALVIGLLLGVIVARR